jgi:hypothetical protein
MSNRCEPSPTGLCPIRRGRTTRHSSCRATPSGSWLFVSSISVGYTHGYPRVSPWGIFLMINYPNVSP